MFVITDAADWAQETFGECEMDLPPGWILRSILHYLVILGSSSVFNSGAQVRMLPSATMRPRTKSPKSAGSERRHRCLNASGRLASTARRPTFNRLGSEYFTIEYCAS